MDKFDQIISSFKSTNLFLKLQEVGGHKVYHTEGNALVHTKMVYNAAVNLFGKDSFMVIVAVLHDIGKIFSSQCHGDNDWTYANHSIEGAKHLYLFIDESDPMYATYYWYIENHIKPLFWHKQGVNTTPAPSKFCTLQNLAKLAYCDILGSIPADLTPNHAKDFLENYIKK